MYEKGYAEKQSVKMLLKDRKSKVIIDRLDLELTERCNNSCIHCYINLPADDITARSLEMTSAEVQQILQEAAALGCMTVRFTGGEPLLRQDFPEIYLAARNLGLKVIILTNAALITPELADLFRRVPPLERLEVTIYGMKKESCEFVTQTPGSFEATRKGMGLLLEHRIPFVVKGALLPSNLNEINEFETWASALPWMDAPPPYLIFLDLRGRRDSEEKNRRIRKLRFSPEQSLDLLKRNSEAYRQDMQEFCRKFLEASNSRLFSCGAGLGDGCVDAYGRLQPCVLMRHPDMVYDLRKGSLKDALTEFFPKIRQIEPSDPEYLKRCAHCFIQPLCEQCPAKSWMEYGTYDTPVDYFCKIAHVQARDLGLIKEGEKAWRVRDWRGRIKKISSNQGAADGIQS